METKEFELSKEFFEQISLAIEQKEDAEVLAMLDDLYAQDISTILDEMSTEQCIYVMELLDDDLGAEILSNLDDEITADFLDNFKPKHIARWIEHIDSDDAADILNEIKLKKREKTLAYVQSLEKVQDIIDLLKYAEDSAGGLMAKEFIQANINWTIAQAIEEIKRQAENVEKIYSLYVVDNQNVLLGRVSLKRMMLTNSKQKISDIYEPDIIFVKTYKDEDEVADLMQKYDLDALPVVNARKQLVGRITIDDIVDVITLRAEQERQIMSGLSEDIEEDDNIWRLTRARLPWLIIGMGGGLLGAKFIGIFEKDLIALPAMAFFIPLITATGGNVGIQSSSIILQSLANPSFKDSNYFRRLFRVLIVAIINGLVIGLIVFGFSFIIDNSLNLAIVVATALFFVVLLASIMGTITPLILDKLNINPAVASGPFITTANDLLGLAIYFSTARFLY